MSKRKNSIRVNFNTIDDVNRFINRVVHELTAGYVNNPSIKGPIVYGFSVHIDHRGPATGPVDPKQTQIAKQYAKSDQLIDIIEKPKHLSVLAELPGMDRSSIGISASNSKLRISTSWLDGSYSRSVDLPIGVNPRKAVAKYNNGVLEITFSKSQSHSDEVKIALS